MNWRDLCPPDVALHQERWERQQLARRMKDCGLSTEEVAKRMNIKPWSVRALLQYTRHSVRRSPVLVWCDSKQDIAVLAVADKPPAD